MTLVFVYFSAKHAALRRKSKDWVVPRVVPISTIMRWLTGQCSWTTTLGHIEPELYNIFLQQEAVQTIPWPAMSPDMNPIELVWDFIGRKINQRNPKCQNIDELRTAILQEWQQFPQERFRRLVRSMTRRVTELHNKRGGYTRY